ncbi:MAG TPA: signal peptidase I [Peptococcaceae bacterium]|nr:signal peptidase I [Peptococcaceae bacterium]
MSQETQRAKESIWKDILEAVILAIILAAVIRIWLFEPFYIPSPSMETTLMTNDRIIVNKFIYKINEPERGDIIVFQYPLDPERDFVKRVIALEGETIEVRDNYVYINGKRLEEPYIQDTMVSNFGPVRVPKDHLFVMGDNRNNSDDSRVWGALHTKYLVGKTVFKYWPLNRIGDID